MSNVCAVGKLETEIILCTESFGYSGKFFEGEGFALELLIEVLGSHSYSSRQSRLRYALVGYCHIDFLRYDHIVTPKQINTII